MGKSTQRRLSNDTFSDCTEQSGWVYTGAALGPVMERFRSAETNTRRRFTDSPTKRVQSIQPRVKPTEALAVKASVPVVTGKTHTDLSGWR